MEGGREPCGTKHWHSSKRKSEGMHGTMQRRVWLVEIKLYEFVSSTLQTKLNTISAKTEKEWTGTIKNQAYGDTPEVPSSVKAQRRLRRIRFGGGKKRKATTEASLKAACSGTHETDACATSAGDDACCKHHEGVASTELHSTRRSTGRTAEPHWCCSHRDLAAHACVSPDLVPGVVPEEVSAPKIARRCLKQKLQRQPSSYVDHDKKLSQETGRGLTSEVMCGSWKNRCHHGGVMRVSS